MALHFSTEELSARRRAAADEMSRRGLTGMLLFKQESMYYLTGYDTFGYVFFQCLYLGADGETMTLLTRTPDLLQAYETSVIEDVRVWIDGPEANPAQQLKEIVEEHGVSGERIGIETDAYGLTGYNYKLLAQAFESVSVLVEVSDLVSKLRLIKSPQELAYTREAARLADNAYDSAIKATGPGAFEGDILAAVQGEIFKGGGDFPANEVIIGSGRRSLLFRYAAGMQSVGDRDQLSLEWAGVYRHYHAAMMQTLFIGQPQTQHEEMFGVVKDTLGPMIDTLQPGEPIGRVDETHRVLLDKAGFGNRRYSACGYSQGTTFAPNWMDWPMLYSGNSLEAKPGMVFFIHCVLVDSDAGVGVGVGRTCLVTEQGREILSRHPVDMILV